MQEELIKDIEQLFEDILGKELENSNLKGLPERIESGWQSAGGQDADNKV